jgi:hypothetical protein
MRHARALDQLDDEHYARVEAIILDLQLSISSVKRANGCLDLETVRNIRARAAETLAHADFRVAELRADLWQTRRLGERRRDLTLLLQEPAPIENLARSLRVG